MANSMSWIHGNALSIETPIVYDTNGNEIDRLTVTPRGSGAVVQREKPGYGATSWLHLPIPIGRVSAWERCELLSVVLIFQIGGAVLDNVHLYDGGHPVQQFNGLNRGDDAPFNGKYLSKGPANTFTLEKPYPVRTGLGVSFFFQAPTGEGDRWLVVHAAGAELRTYPAWLGPLRRP